MEQAEKIRAARLRLNWSKRRLAREAGVGTDLIHKLEAGERILPTKLMSIMTVLTYGTQAK